MWWLFFEFVVVLVPENMWLFSLFGSISQHIMQILWKYLKWMFNFRQLNDYTSKIILFITMSSSLQCMHTHIFATVYTHKHLHYSVYTQTSSLQCMRTNIIATVYAHKDLSYSVCPQIFWNTFVSFSKC